MWPGNEHVGRYGKTGQMIEWDRSGGDVDRMFDLPSESDSVEKGSVEEREGGLSKSIDELDEEIKKAKGLSAAIAEGIQKNRRIFVRISSQHIRPILRHALERLGFRHLSTITGVDLGSEVQVIYHLADGGLILSLIVPLEPVVLVLPTITDLVPGATLYEREIHDLFGVKFEGHTNLSRLILPDNWPPQSYPLRRKWGEEKKTK